MAPLGILAEIVPDAGFVVGALFVGLYAMGRFNTPPGSRSRTTAGRYYTTCGFYVAFMVLLYLILARWPELLDEVISLAQSPEQPDSSSENRPGQALIKSWRENGVDPRLVAAFVVTAFMTKAPFLSHFDQKVRGWLHRVASIPYEALSLSNRLRKCDWQAPARDHEQITEALVDDGVRRKDILLTPTNAPQDSLQRLWTKTATLMHYLDSWTTDRNLVAFLEGVTVEYSDLKKRYKRAQSRAAGILDCISELSSEEGKPAFERAARELADSLRGICNDLLGDMYDFISRGVLSCRSRAAARRKQLVAMGFVLNPKDFGGLTGDHFVALFLSIGALVLVSSISLRTGVSPPETKTMLLMAVMVAAIYVSAVFCAIYPKRRWGWGWRGGSTIRPYSRYLLSGVMAVPVAAMLSLSGNYVLNASWSEVWVQFQDRYMFFVMPFMTALVTAFLADNETDGMSPARLRRLEGLIQCGVNLTAMSFVCVSLRYAGNLSENPPWYIILVAGMLGFGLGFMVPNWYRKSIAGARAMTETGEFAAA